MKLKISDELSLPVDVTTQAVGWLGRRGSGKTYGATKLAELLEISGARFIAIDPVGVWYGLRLGVDGKSHGISVPVFGGLHGDIPLEATGVALIADVIVDRNINAVLDVSQFESDSDRARFAGDFAARFFHRKKSNPSAVHIFVEEAQELVTTYLAHHRCGVPRSTQNVLSWGKRVKVPPVVIRCVNGTELALKTATVATVLEPSG
jgi:hypothetical protein